MHRKFVCRAKDADGDFLEMGEIICGSCTKLVVFSYPAVCDKDFCQGPAVTSSLAAHGLDGVHGRARRTGGSGKYRCKPGGVKSRHDGGSDGDATGLLQDFIIGWGRAKTRWEAAINAFKKVKITVEDDVYPISWRVAREKEQGIVCVV